MATYSFPWSRELFKNPYEYSLRYDKDIQNLFSEKLQAPPPVQYEMSSEKDRSLFRRVIDALSLGNYASAGFVNSIVEGENPLKGAWEGIKAANPFGDGNPKGAITYSDVFENAGWEPESLPGKITKGTLGFVFDVALDPATYLTGGASATIKGSGVTAKTSGTLNKILKELPAKQYDNVFSRVLKAGGSPEDAIDVAKKSVDALTDKLSNREVTKMTDDIAKIIVEERMRKGGLQLTPDELNASAERLTREFNRLLGLRDPGKITFGIGNLPFMPKKYQDKVWTISSDEPLRYISDKLGVSKAYSGLRDFIYGSQIGKMFSTSAPLKKLAEKDPAMLWETLEHAKMVRGLNLDKIQSEKLIMDRFKSFNLTPAESKEIIELLENKTVWSKISKRINLKKTDEGQRFYQTLVKAQNDMGKELDTLIKERDAIETLRQASDFDIDSANEVLDKLNKEYTQRLLNLDTTFIRGKEKIEKTIDFLDNEIKRLNDELPGLADFDKQFDSLYDEVLKERLARKEHLAKKEALESYAKVLRDGGDATPFEAKVGKLNAEQLNREIYKLHKKTPTLEKRFKFVQLLSQYIYGDKNKLDLITDDGLDKLVKLYKKHPGSPSTLEKEIQLNPHLYSSHERDVWGFIAKELGYKKWTEDGFNVPMGKILGMSEEEAIKRNPDELYLMGMKLLKRGQLMGWKERAFISLANKYMKREVLRSQYLKMTPEEFAKHKADLVYKRDVEEINRMIEDDMLDSIRSTFNDEDYGIRQEQKTSAFQPIDPLEEEPVLNLTRAELADAEYERFKRYYQKAAENAEFVEFESDLIRFNFFTDEALLIDNGYKLKDYIDKVYNEVGLLVKNAKRSYRDMSDAQKKFTIRQAMDNVSKGISVRDKRLRKLSNIAKREATRRIRKEVMDNIAKTARIGDDIVFLSKDGQEITGRIIGRYSKNDLLYYRVKSDALTPIIGKSVAGVSIRNVKALKKNNVVKTVEELLLDSDLAKATVYERDELVKELKKMKDVLAKRSDKYARLREITIDKFEKRIARQRDFIKQMEESKNKLDRSLMRADYNADEVERLTLQLERQRELLNNDDAFDTYMRSKLSEDEIKEIEKKHADLGRIWLDERASSKKIADTVRTLRSLFDEIGMKEVEIGKLSKEQFEQMLGRYVPHILTPDGEDFVRLNKEIIPRDTPPVTFELGYGLKFNPHRMKRTIKGTIAEINKDFEDALKGKNLFSENIADIYLARALKHNELIYDNKYMRTMLDVFGKDVPLNGNVDEGYRAVMNFGMLRKTAQDMTRMQMSLRISDEVTEFIRNNASKIRKMAKASNLNPDELLQKHIDEFIKKNFPEEKMGELWEELYGSVLKAVNLPNQILAEDATPMVELSKKQINLIRTLWDSTYNSYKNNLQTQLRKTIDREIFERGEYFKNRKEITKVLNDLDYLDWAYENHSVSEGGPSLDKISELYAKTYDKFLDLVKKESETSERVKSILHNFDKLSKFDPPQIKQVNEAIVAKANQARKLQLAKDQSRFLQLYDKFLHFMKLNQTVVSPAFHTRNKLSNLFQSWLGVGRDALNPKMQLPAFHLARFNGDANKLAEFMAKNKRNKDMFRPLIITKAHPELIEAVGMQNGVLNWTDAYLLARQYDVVDTGQFAKDIGAGSASRGVLKGLKRTKADGARLSFDPTDTANFFLYKKGTEVGSAIENTDRFVQFVSYLKQGKSPYEAAELVKKFLFDYSDLTAFEQHVMKRIFPYYTWLRKNVRLQVSQLIEQPEKYLTVAKILNGIEHSVPEDERMNPLFISDWAEDWVQLPLDVTVEGAVFDEYGDLVRSVKREKLLLNPALPFMDFNRIPDPTRPIESIETLFSQLTPAMKVPVELALNRNVFLDSKIVRDNGENPALQLVDYLSGQFAVGNVTKGFFKDNAVDVGLHALNQLTGVKIATYDYETSKFMKLDEMREKGLAGDPKKDEDYNLFIHHLEQYLEKLRGE